jgi:hypothetical protein
VRGPTPTTTKLTTAIVTAVREPASHERAMAVM